MMKRNKKRTLWILAIATLMLVLGALIFAGNFFFDFALNRNSKNNIMGGADDAAHNTVDFEKAQPNAEEAWFDVTARDIYLTGADGLKLHAYTLMQKTETDKYLIICHGYLNNAKAMHKRVKHFYDLGFNVVAPNARAHGKSEGDIRGMGWLERKDMLLWIDGIVKDSPAAKIAMYGVSMGGATVMMTSGENLPPQVKVLIEDCGYTSVWDEFAYQLKKMYGLPSFPIMNIASLISQVRGGYSFTEASAVGQVAKCKLPMLFIHGDQDDFVPFYMLEQVYDAATCEKEKLVIAGAEHGQAVTVNPKLYWDTVDAFLERINDDDN